MLKAYKSYWINYCNFKGRSKRSEYWWVVLMNFIISSIIVLINYSLGGTDLEPNKFAAFLMIFYTVLIILPSISLVVRRLHDTNRSGWNYLLSLIPFFGTVLLLIFICSPSVNIDNKYDI